MEKLNSLYSDVSHWLTFAETKNAALLTLNITLLIFTFEYLSEKDKYSLSIWIYCFIVLILISTIMTLISFLAKIHKYNLIINNKKLHEGNNLLYYKDIAKYSVDEYYNEFIHRYGDEPSNLKDIQYSKDLINQIIIISSIAYNKYYLFNIALFITLIPFGSMIIMIILA